MKKVVVLKDEEEERSHISPSKHLLGSHSCNSLIEKEERERMTHSDAFVNQDNLVKSQSHDGLKQSHSHGNKYKKHKYVHKLIFKKSELEKSDDSSSDFYESHNQVLSSSDSASHKKHGHKFYTIGKSKESKVTDKTSDDESEKLRIHVINHNHEKDSCSHHEKDSCSNHSTPLSPRHKQFKLVGSSSPNSETHSAEEIYNGNKTTVIKHYKRHSLEVSSSFKFNNDFKDGNVASSSSNSRYSTPNEMRKSPSFENSASEKSNTMVHFANGQVQIDEEGFLEEIDFIRNYCGDEMSSLIAGLGGDFDFEDSSF